jgi:DNA-binding winged helix-turn-helix (wHTH) protein/tetratricopeptide (TPR) repeat protein
MAVQDRISAYAFGPFVIHLRERVLYRMGLPVEMHARLFEILECLVLHGDRVVTKDALVHEVWDGSAIGDNNIAQHVHLVRQVLSDVARPHRYIETVHGRGYRLIVEPRPVTEILPPLEATMAPDGVVARSLAAELISNAAFFQKMGTPAALDSSMQLCRQALAMQHDLADAHAGIAYAAILKAAFCFSAPREQYAMARRHALAALEFEPRCARAHAALGALALLDDCSPAQAHRHLDAAAAGLPQLPEASALRILAFAAQGRHESARASALEATIAFGASGAVRAYAGFAAYLAGDFTTAGATLERIRIFNGGAAFATYLLGLVRLAQEDYAAAEELFHQLLTGRISALPGYEKFRMRATAAAAFVAARTGFPNDARALARDVERSPNCSHVALAVVQMGLDAPDEAIASLERARSQGDSWFPFVACDPVFRALHGLPEFTRVCAPNSDLS